VSFVAGLVLWFLLCRVDCLCWLLPRWQFHCQPLWCHLPGWSFTR